MRCTSTFVALVAALTLTTGLAACGGEDAEPGSTPEFRQPALPTPDAFAAEINHPYLPLRPGSRWVYRAQTEDGVEEIVVTVLTRPRLVAGIAATEVRDRVTLDGELIEDTLDWYAQDRDGNVWYLGEATTAYQDGDASTAGSWEAGVDGARAGLALPADPEVGDLYQQELSRGVAEDRGEIIALDARGRVPWGAFSAAVRTRDTTPLEPDVLEYKYYAEGVGLVLEEDDGVRLELVSYRPSPE